MRFIIGRSNYHIIPTVTLNSLLSGSTLGQPWTAFQAWTSQGKQVSPSKMVDSLPCPLEWLRVKEPDCQCRRCGFDPWVGKTPWIRTWPPTPVFLPGKSHGQRSLADCSPYGRRVGHDLAAKQQHGRCSSLIILAPHAFPGRQSPAVIDLSDWTGKPWRWRGRKRLSGTQMPENQPLLAHRVEFNYSLFSCFS